MYVCVRLLVPSMVRLCLSQDTYMQHVADKGQSRDELATMTDEQLILGIEEATQKLASETVELEKSLSFLASREKKGE